jgi:hypothetical protein
VARAPDVVRERVDARREAQRVMEEDHSGHRRSSFGRSGGRERTTPLRPAGGPGAAAAVATARWA